MVILGCGFGRIESGKNAAQIIEKVITRGDIADWHEIREYYGLKRIAEEAKQLRYLDDLTLNFVSRLFNIPKEEFRCYQLKQKYPGAWKF